MMRVEDQRERLAAPSLLKLAAGPIAAPALDMRNFHDLKLGAPAGSEVKFVVRPFLPKNCDSKRGWIARLLDKIAHCHAEFRIAISRDLDEDPAAARLGCRGVE